MDYNGFQISKIGERYLVSLELKSDIVYLSNSGKLNKRRYYFESQSDARQAVDNYNESHPVNKRSDYDTDSISDSQQGISLLGIAKKAIDEIQKYATSDEEENRLIAFNVILTFLILTFTITEYISPIGVNIQDNLFIFIIYLGAAALFSIILCLGYLYLINTVASIILKDYFALKLSIGILFFNTGLSFVGLLFNNKPLLVYGIGLWILQVIALLLVGFIKVPVKDKLEKHKESVFLGWVLLGRVSDIGGVISLLVWGGTIVLKALGIQLF